MKNILSIKDLRTYFHTDDGIAKAVDGVSFDLKEGETLGIVGESGCGKSVTALSILRLLPKDVGVIEGGEILFEGKDIVKMSDIEIRTIRGNKISMIFQEPMTSLNPAYTCGNQIVEVIKTHQNVNGSEAKSKTIDILKSVGIPSPEQRFNEYPHQLSGGLRQRARSAFAFRKFFMRPSGASESFWSRSRGGSLPFAGASVYARRRVGLRRAARSPKNCARSSRQRGLEFDPMIS